MSPLFGPAENHADLLERGVISAHVELAARHPADGVIDSVDQLERNQVRLKPHGVLLVSRTCPIAR